MFCGHDKINDLIDSSDRLCLNARLRDGGFKVDKVNGREWEKLIDRIFIQHEISDYKTANNSFHQPHVAAVVFALTYNDFHSYKKKS